MDDTLIIENEIIKIDFEIDRNNMIFRDALYLPINHNLSDAELDALKEERYTNWMLSLSPPQPQEIVE